jgi:hypothetical protein
VLAVPTAQRDAELRVLAVLDSPRAHDAGQAGGVLAGAVRDSAARAGRSRVTALLDLMALVEDGHVLHVAPDAVALPAAMR